MQELLRHDFICTVESHSTAKFSNGHLKSSRTLCPHLPLYRSSSRVAGSLSTTTIPLVSQEVLMRAAIDDALRTISSTHNVTVLLAVESGSRAWGFPSTDSDYDVRFIYHHPSEWYLSLYEGSDVIEQSLKDSMLDLGGWELRKTLRLIAKGNIAPYEWLQSPIVYSEAPKFRKATWEIVSSSYSLRGGLHHYSSLVRHVLDDLKGDTIKVKRCFYGLRAALAARWILEHESIPPIVL